MSSQVVPDPSLGFGVAVLVLVALFMILFLIKYFVVIRPRVISGKQVEVSSMIKTRRLTSAVTSAVCFIVSGAAFIYCLSVSGFDITSLAFVAVAALMLVSTIMNWTEYKQYKHD